jgi:conjugative relaxase-like TrwC/TraI family protein
VLSIGKLGAGQAKYYLDQAEGRVDVVDSVGDGIEEYYVGGPEVRGDWAGAAAAELGLNGAVDGEALRRVLAGLDPRDGTPLRSSTSPTRVGGFDLTFSAPKSASVLFGVGGADVRAQVRAAHDRAVREAVGYLERSAAAVRRGHGGAVVEEASGFVAAAFRHRTSRAGDPQLHTHVLVANLGRGVDGRWSALDVRRLYAHAKTASFIYQAVLRGELTRRLDVQWTPVRKGIAEVVGVPRSVLVGFSRRRAEIEAALQERGTSGARAAEAAALATRRPKDQTTDAEQLVREWRARAAELGLGEQELARIVGRARSAEPDERAWRRVGQQLASPLGLTGRDATFTRDDVIQGFCEWLPPGVRLDAPMIEAAADRFLASPEAVPLVPAGEERDGGEAFRRRDGRIVPVERGRLLYSTPAQLALEQQLIERVLEARGGTAGETDPAQVARALAARPTMSSEQRTVVERLCLDGDHVTVLAGKPGTGKTFVLGAAREAWQAAGHPVIGVATARRAAAELQEAAGIQSTSTAALLGDLRRGGGPGLPQRCVLVVDEAGMVATRDIAELIDRTLAVDGKVVLVGDHRQLPELQAGGTFRALVQRGFAQELHENVRQVHAWERRALDHLRDGRPEPALELYARHDRLVVEPTSDASRQRLVEDWWAARDPDGAVMIARRRSDVADLNARARARMREAGALDGPDIDTPAGPFAVGDSVVVKRNDLRRSVNNGDRARVVAVDGDRGGLTIDRRGERIRLDGEFLSTPTAAGDPPLVHGYAITGHVAQGLTVDHAFVLATDGVDREWAYVAMSRGRHSNRLYLAAEPDDDRAEFAPVGRRTADPVERLARDLRSSGAKVLAIDAGRPIKRNVPADAFEQAAHERRALEGRRFGWLPGRRRQLAAAREREAAAYRERFEIEHGARPFVDEADFAAAADRFHARQAERATERVLRNDRGIGREL